MNQTLVLQGFYHFCGLNSGLIRGYVEIAGVRDTLRGARAEISNKTKRGDHLAS